MKREILAYDFWKLRVGEENQVPNLAPQCYLCVLHDSVVSKVVKPITQSHSGLRGNEFKGDSTLRNQERSDCSELRGDRLVNTKCSRCAPGSVTSRR